MNVEWNDAKTEATLSKEDYENLEARAKASDGNFTTGYTKGQEKGKKDLLDKLSFLEINPEDIEGSLAKYRQTIQDIKDGKIPAELLDKVKDSNIVKDLQEKLVKVTGERDSSLTEFEKFRKKTLIDDQLVSLATAAESVSATNVKELFKLNYQVDVGQDGKISIKNQNGTPVFNEKGEELSLDAVFGQFKNSNPYLFKAPDSSGSGGGNGKVPAGVTYKDLKGKPEAIVKFTEEHGTEAFQKLVDNYNFAEKKE